MIKALLTLAIVMAILFVVYAAERLLDRYRPATGMWTRILIALVLACIVGTLGIRLAQARADTGVTLSPPPDGFRPY